MLDFADAVVHERVHGGDTKVYFLFVGNGFMVILLVTYLAGINKMLSVIILLAMRLYLENDGKRE